VFDRDDEQFKIYLKSFRPLAPQALPIAGVGNTPGSRLRIAFAFTAVGCLAAASVLLIVISHRADRAGIQAISPAEIQASRVEPSTPVLTRLALDEHEAFAEFLSEKAKSQFPAMRSERSTLRVLARE